MAKAMTLIRLCTLLFLMCLFTACASTKLPVAPEAQSLKEVSKIVQHVEQNEVIPYLVSVSADTEVSKNFALESIPITSMANTLVSIFKIPSDTSDEIVKAAERNAYSDFPSRNDILAIIAVESSFNPKAFLLGNMGLMQVRKKSHIGKLKGRSLFNIEANIEIGVIILREYFIKFGCDRKAAILSYNSGDGNYSKGRFHYEYYKKFLKALSYISKIQ